MSVSTKITSAAAISDLIWSFSVKFSLSYSKVHTGQNTEAPGILGIGAYIFCLALKINLLAPELFFLNFSTHCI